jgi:choline dehydrogenase-like flavoprotein
VINIEHFDAVVIGAGAGGGVAACKLAEAGKRVLLLERGRAMTFEEIGRHPLKNQRVIAYGHNAGPFAGHPRVSVDADGTEHVLQPWDPGYQPNAAVVGGGTRVYGGQAWRFHPLDFKMASTYGVPEGASLADWPFGIETLAPFYDAVEHELGVSGDAAPMNHLPEFARNYPMPPLPLTKRSQLLRAGAEALGWHTIPVPLAINSQPYQDRPACSNCQHCVGFACPLDAKNGTQNTFLPRALATGKCELRTDTMVERIETHAGRATGVCYFTPDRRRWRITADVIVVAAGAVESARLLLNSGLGNDHVGRHLQGHVYVAAAGLMAEAVWDGIGPGPTTATTHWSHGNAGIIGGGMLCDDFIALPTAFWRNTRPHNAPLWGQASKDWMRTRYTHTLEVKGPIQETPSPNARVTVDAKVKDRFGIPVARLSGTTHPESIRTAQFLHAKAVEWLKAAGALEIWGDAPQTPYLSGHQHQAGTCRMGEDPATSAVDIHGRLHGHDNLYVTDTSVHVTNGGFNPFLTAMAMAYRTVSGLIERW